MDITTPVIMPLTPKPLSPIKEPPAPRHKREYMPEPLTPHFLILLLF